MSGLYVAISPHGFGHTTRTASIVAAIQEQLPHLPITIVTTAPPWLLDSYLVYPYDYRSLALDVGVVQSDSLQMDWEATIEQIQALRQHSPALIATESAYIQSQGIELVLADMPALGVSIARSAGVPCWISSNFGWDLIYQEWLGEYPALGEIIDWLMDAYQHCDRLFRLPFHEPMAAFPRQEDVGLTGGTPRFSAPELYTKLALDCQRPIVLLTFGGLSLHQIPYQNVDRYPDIQFLTFDQDSPPKANLTKLSGHQLRPVDIMPICERIISKPGYSTLSEACRLNIPITCLTRSGFSESAYLLEGMQDYMHHQIITPHTFYTGPWEFLTETPQPPRTGLSLPLHGEQTIANTIVHYLIDR